MTSGGGPSDQRWMGAAIALSLRGRGQTAPNPNVGCIIVKDSHVVGRGWTAPGGRPHAEAMALEEAGDAATGATVYVTLEPCAHVSKRGPACADLLVEAKPARVIIAAGDPDRRTDGRGAERLRAAGIDVVEGIRRAEAEAAMPGFFCRQRLGRPHVTLKLATSLDGCIALADGTSRWITGEHARAHAHLERALSDLIVVGRGTLEADQPRLDVRLAGLESRSPRRAVLTTGDAPDDWGRLAVPQDIALFDGVDHVLVEGGASAAAAFLAADLVDRLLLYRAPMLIGGGKPCLGDIGLTSLAAAHGLWKLIEQRRFDADTLDVFERVR